LKTAFEKIDIRQVEKLASYGHTDNFMADFFGVSVTHWNRWKLAHPKFRAKLQDWKSVADAQIERALFERAIGFEMQEIICEVTGTELIIKDISIDELRVVPEWRKAIKIKRLAPDVSACIFWLKNRDPEHWRDRIEIAGSNDRSLGSQVAEARQRLQQLKDTKKISKAPIFALPDGSGNGGGE